MIIAVLDYTICPMITLLTCDRLAFNVNRATRKQKQRTNQHTHTQTTKKSDKLVAKG